MVSSSLFAGMIIAVAFTLSHFNFFGSADALVLTFISLAMPSFPSIAPILPVFPTSSIQFSFPFSVLSNGVLVAVVSVFYAAGRNIVWKFKRGEDLFEGLENPKKIDKILALLTGYRVKLSELGKSPHIFPLEDVSIEGKRLVRRLRISIGVRESRDLTIVTFKKFAKRASDMEIWVTYGLPMVFLFTTGFVLSLLFGNLIHIALCSIFRLV